MNDFYKNKEISKNENVISIIRTLLSERESEIESEIERWKKTKSENKVNRRVDQNY